MVAQYPLVHGVVGATAKGGNFNAVLYTGDGAASHQITGVGFQPDLTWIKRRTGGSASHRLYDAARGATLSVLSDTDSAELTNANGLLGFDPDGFTVGNLAGVNSSGDEFVSWNWLANETATHASHDGERYNLKTGLSIIKYTGDGVQGRLVRTSLPSAAQLVMVKSRGVIRPWRVYHAGINNAPNYYLELNTDANAVLSATIWNGTAPTADIILGADVEVNNLGEEYILYAFCNVPGFSQFGHYIGDGASPGPTIITNFRPGFPIIKAVDTTALHNWQMYDSKRSTSNPRRDVLQCDTPNAEVTGNGVNFNDTNFQIDAGGTSINENGKRYVYSCFAEAA